MTIKNSHILRVWIRYCIHGNQHKMSIVVVSSPFHVLSLLVPLAILWAKFLSFVRISEKIYSKIVPGESHYAPGKIYCRRCECYFIVPMRFKRLLKWGLKRLRPGNLVSDNSTTYVIFQTSFNVNSFHITSKTRKAFNSLLSRHYNFTAPLIKHLVSCKGSWTISFEFLKKRFYANNFEFQIRNQVWYLGAGCDL